MDVYYAHIADDGRKQSVDAHLQGSAELCALFASAFNAAEYGWLAGMMHDIGKYSDGFRKRLAGGPRVDHSSAGALECVAAGEMLTGMCVAGHHGGLPDYGNAYADMPGDGTFIGRMKKFKPNRGKACPGWNGHIPEAPAEPEFKDDYVASMWTRMLYSSLVDADFLDTEAFMNGTAVRKYFYDDIPALCKKLDEYASKWSKPKNELDKLRNGVREDCITAGKSAKGIYTLTVPTGGGKTVSSLAFALEHAKTHGMSRVIYVIPYTSIIEQNAAVFREILGDKNVLEHHSEAEFSYGEDLSEEEKRAAYAAENWDAPVVVTTAVQFFESLYANKPSKCRKLHNVANSVIIFDEAQMIPVSHLLPCCAAIGTLVGHFGATAVLCTATQPFVSDILKNYYSGEIREICSDTAGLFNSLARVTFTDAGFLTTDLLAAELSERRQVLCVVNTRKSAQEVFALLPPEGSFHLSTLMYPAHRREVLAEIRKRLRDGLPCRVVSTSLIEAGVDVDFPEVFREKSGLDSIIQAAGRCNREGKRPVAQSVVTVFRTEGKTPPAIRVGVGATDEVIKVFDGETASPKTVYGYFKSYRELVGKENTDKTNAVGYLTRGKSGCRLPFAAVAESFRLIDTATRTVYIANERSLPLIDAIRDGRAGRAAYSEAGKYGVDVYTSHFNDLLLAGDIEELPGGGAVLLNKEIYDNKTGLSLKAAFGKAEFE